MNDNTTPVSDRLVQDLRVLVADAEELVKATAAETGERIRTTRARLEDHLRHARARLAEAEQALIDKSKIAAAATDRYAHENPWKVAGIAAGLGLLLGLLLGRRD
ncbi:MAG: hypothetical protein A3I63_04665 [Betaproteobacteria bacterium RIFCSPLOWO2_02_FULL_66_14]|nr:MAG: hypothetical protein A3I63_04665 [Betaproteobacteria bacterium RIFCSPLOWO2_02_FULL_66_14]